MEFQWYVLSKDVLSSQVLSIMLGNYRILSKRLVLLTDSCLKVSDEKARCRCLWGPTGTARALTSWLLAIPHKLHLFSFTTSRKPTCCLSKITFCAPHRRRRDDFKQNCKPSSIVRSFKIFLGKSPNFVTSNSAVSLTVTCKVQFF